MLFNLAAHWLIGLPLAYVLCFWAGWGVAGLWVGLSVSLILIGAGLVAVWHRRSRAFRAGLGGVVVDTVSQGAINT
jgi:MATE family multidrug resistance protein